MKSTKVLFILLAVLLLIAYHKAIVGEKVVGGKVIRETTWWD